MTPTGRFQYFSANWMTASVPALRGSSSDGGLGHDRETKADLDRAFDRLDVVELRHLFYLDLVLPKDAVHRFSGRHIALEVYKVLP